MNPIILHIFGPFSVSWYGALVVTGLSLFMYLAYNDIRRSAIVSTLQFFDCATAGVIGGVLGGKLLFLLTQASSLSCSSWYDFAALVIGGFAILGAILGAVLGILITLRIHNVQILPFLDLAGAYALVAHGIARLGCLIAGCCYGMWWPHVKYAITYTHELSLAPCGVPLFPVQLLMSIVSLIGFGVCYSVYQMRGRREGLVFSLYVLWESAARFGVDFFRGDREIMWLGLGVYQFVALGMVFATCIYLAYFVYRPQTRRRW